MLEVGPSHKTTSLQPSPRGRFSRASWAVDCRDHVPDSKWFSFSQIVHHNIVEGHLLVNGRPRGKLPLEIRDNPAVKDMFGTSTS